jgi:NADH-quinone oxidoreductase subunit M
MALLLVLTILLPLIGSLFLFAMPGYPAKSARSLTLALALATLGLSLILVLGFDIKKVGPQFSFVDAFGSVGLVWLPRLGVRLAFGLDGISLWLFALTSLLMITAVFSSWDSVTEKAPTHYALLLALQSGLLGVFSSLDIILFYCFFEFTLIPLFFLIGIFGGPGPQRRKAATTYFLTMLAGSLLMLLGLISLVAVYYQHTSPHILTFSIPELTEGLRKIEWDQWNQPHSWFDPSSEVPFWTSPQVLIFLLLFAGFAIKVPIFPFQTWVPLVYVEAPMSATILLAGVMAKVGTYGLLRFNLAMTPIGAQALSPLLTTLATITILYAALAALAQTDLKRLVAYSSISHMGFIALGLFSLNATGMDGAVIQMVNHGLTTGALFACLGVVFERYQTREMADLGGLWDRMPLWSFFLILASLGAAALPGLNGFIGEFPILLGMFRSNPTTAVFATLGMILGAYYLLLMLQKVVFGPLKEPITSVTSATAAGPIGWPMIAGLTPLMVLIVWIGIVPKPFLDRYQASLKPIAAQLESKKDQKSVVDRIPTQNTLAATHSPARANVTPSRSAR